MNTANNGVIPRERLEQRLVKIEKIEEKHVKNIVQLLEKFHVVVPIGYNSLLVPALLMDDTPIVTMAKGNFPRPCTLPLYTVQPCYLPKPITTVPPLQMLGTGVVIRRLYVLHGIPIGFWPKLIAHFYTEKVFSSIVKQAIKRALQYGVDAGDEFAPKWQYRKRNIELVINNTTILAIGSVGRDYMDMNQKCQRHDMDLSSFHFINNDSEWDESEFKFFSGVLIEVNDFVFVSSNSEEVIDCTPDLCQHTAELLAFAVEMLDSLLSDIFLRTSFFDDSSWLKELIPCPYCTGDKPVGRVDGDAGVDQIDDKVNCCSKHNTVHDLSQENDLIYYFTVNHCLNKVKNRQSVSCPRHGRLVIECLAPDLVG